MGTACAKVLRQKWGWRNELQVHEWIVITESTFIHLFNKHVLESQPVWKILLSVEDLLMVLRSFPVSHHSCRGQTGFVSWWASIAAEDRQDLWAGGLLCTWERNSTASFWLPCPTLSTQVWDLKLWGRGAPEPSDTLTISMSPESLGALPTVWQSSAWNLSLSKPWLPRSRKGPLLPASRDCCEVWDNYLWTCPVKSLSQYMLNKERLWSMKCKLHITFYSLT